MTALQILADWVTTKQSNHSPLARERAKQAFLDTIAVILFGQDSPSVSAAKRVGASWGAGASTVIGGGERLPALSAALINGTAAHAYDFDDYEDPGATHISAVLVPALLAIGEELEASGAALLDAYIIGLEVAVQIGYAVNMSHYKAGWHATATIGRLAAAAAIARLKGLSPQQVAHALSISTSSTGGYSSQFGTGLKPLHAGLAARGGIEAAALAEAGLDAALEALDGERSFLNLQGGREAPGFHALAGRLKEPLWIESRGLTLKPVPCCGYLLPALYAALELHQKHGVTAENLERLEAGAPAWQTGIIHYVKPANSEEARFSLHYGIAAALIDGKAGPKTFESAAIARPALHRLIDRITVKPLEAGPWDGDIGPTGPIRLEAALQNGQKVEVFVEHHKGTPENPMTADEVAAKFENCAYGRLPSHQVAEARAALASFDKIQNICEFMEIFAAPHKEQIKGAAQ